MNINSSLFFIIGSSFLLGLRHGIDWDHIAAITDITGSTGGKRKSFLMGTIYAFGHATVIIILGLIAVIFGINLPDWVDAIMEPVVGMTLILLGIWLISSIIIHRKNYKMKSRWMILFALVHQSFHRIHQRISPKHDHPHIKSSDTYSMKATFAIGLIHGIGAETPTQVLLFISAAGVAGTLIGSFLVLAFVSGLFLSNTTIVLASVTGYARIHGLPYLRIILGLMTAIFSLVIGVLLIFGKADFLPIL